MKFGLNSLALTSPFSNQHLSMLQDAKDMGFDVFEIDVEDDTLIDCPSIRAAADKAGIGIGLCGAFGDTRDMSAADPEKREHAIAYVKRLIDFAVQLGSGYVAGNMYCATGDCRRRSEEEKQARKARAAESIRICAEYAGQFGIRLGIEPLNRYETDMINTVQQALELLELVGNDQVGLLLDTYHMNIEEVSIPQAIRMAGSRIIDFHACANDRGTPGADHIDWAGIRQALRDVGYDGNIVIESFTDQCVEIAKAASIWRPLAPSQTALARDGVRFLRETLQKE